MNAQANATVAQNRLTIKVKVRFTNTLDDTKDYNKQFSRYRDYDASQIIGCGGSTDRRDQSGIGGEYFERRDCQLVGNGQRPTHTALTEQRIKHAPLEQALEKELNVIPILQPFACFVSRPYKKVSRSVLMRNLRTAAHIHDRRQL